MVQRLTGKNSISASELSRETGVRQQNLSRWLQETRSLPHVGADDPKAREWTVGEKARVIAQAAKLTGEQLTAYLEAEQVKLAELQRWRMALDEDGRASISTT